MRRLTAPVFVLLLTAPPALAQDGFFATADAVQLRNAGASREVVIVDPDADLDVEGDLRAVEAEAVTAPRVSLGYRWRSRWNTPAEITFSGWRSDASGTLAVDAGAGLLWDVLTPPSLALAGYDGSATATLDDDATVIDLSYAQTVLADERAIVRFRAGLRHIAYETRLSADYVSGISEASVRTSSALDTYGVRVAAEGALPLGAGFRLAGEISYGLLWGDVEATYTAASSAGFPGVDVRRGRDRNIDALEGAARLEWQSRTGLGLRAGVEWARWSSAIDQITFTDDIQPGAVVVQAQDAVWYGVSLGVGYRW